MGRLTIEKFYHPKGIHRRGQPVGESRPMGLQTHGRHDPKKKEEEKVGDKEKKCCKFSVKNQIRREKKRSWKRR
jgi:hypothetical protein